MNNLLKKAFLGTLLAGVVVFSGQMTSFAQTATADQTAVSSSAKVFEKNAVLIKQFDAEKDIAKSGDILKQILTGMREQLGSIKMEIAQNGDDATNSQKAKTIQQIGRLYNKVISATQNAEDLKNNKEAITQTLNDYLKLK